MKKSIVLILMLVICATSVFSQTMTLVASGAKGYSTSSTNIMVTMVNQDPDPVEPGKYVDVRFKFENYGQENAEDVQVEILPKYPFSLDPGEEAVKEIGSIHGRQTGDIGTIVKYRLRVDKNAVEGANLIDLRYIFEDSVWIKVSDFIINVRPVGAILGIASVSSTPEQIKPGQTAVIKFTLKNMEDILIKDIKIRLDLTDLSLAPIGSSTEKVIDKLDSNKETEIEFNLLADAEAELGLNKIPVTINYRDILNNNYSISSDIGLLLGSPPDMSVIIDSSTIQQSGNQGEVTVKFVNKGISDIKFLNVKLNPSDDFELLSSDEVYIGNIDSDDYETADFKIFVKKTDKSEIILPINIDYKDAQNKDYEKDLQLKLKLRSKSEAKELGLSNGNSKIGIIVIIVIVVIGLLAYRWWRKRKKK